MVELDSNLSAQISQMLTTLRSNPDVIKMIDGIKELLKPFEIDRFFSRIKTYDSAVATAKRREFASIDEANDYIGLSIVVRDKTTIKDIVEVFTRIFPEGEHVDLLGEDEIYLPNAYIKKVPPVCYNILFKNKVGEQNAVPVEIRIWKKEGCISSEAIHDTIYKNDKLDIPIDEKMQLLGVCQHLIYKLVTLSSDLNSEEKKEQRRELEEIIKNNKAILSKYPAVVRSVLTEYGVHMYLYDHSEEFQKLSENKKREVKEKLRSTYRRLFEEYSGNDFVNKANYPVNTMKSLSLDSIQCEPRS